MRRFIDSTSYVAYRTRMFAAAALVSLLTSAISLAHGGAYAQTYPPEAVYVHWDRDVYSAGATAWFKAYVVSDHAFSTRSTVLHVRLLDPTGRLLLQSVLPVVGGTAAGQLDLPDTLRSGVHVLQAFTPGMLAGSDAAFYERRVYVAGVASSRVSPAATAAVPPLRVRLFPEGGRLLAGVPNRVAFQALWSDGGGADLRGRVVDDSGHLVVEVAAFRNGRGSFAFTPKAGRSYSLRVEKGGADLSFPLPPHVEDAVAIGVAPHPEGFVFTLYDRTSSPERKAAAVAGRMQGRTVFQVAVPADRRDIRGVMRTDPETLRSGILTFVVMNRDGMPLAERRVFYRHPDLECRAALVWDTLDFKPRSPNRFTLKTIDPFAGEFSVSVHDDEPDPLRLSPSSMVADILLKPSLLGWQGEDADWYFRGPADSSEKALDLLMMTEGWSRINWKTAPAKERRVDSPVDPGFIVVRGVVEEPSRSIPRRIMMLMEGSAFGRRTEFADVDAKGRFRIDSLLFFGEASLSFFDPSVKKGKPLKVTLTGAPIGQVGSLPVAKAGFGNRNGVEAGAADAPGLSSSRPAGLFDSAVTMREVLVTAARKTPAQQLNERYAKGLFADGEERLIDLTSPDEQPVQQNIFEYLKFRVPGIQVADPNYEVASMPALGDDPFNDPQGYRVYYRQQPTISSMGNIPMAVYLNEVQTSTNVVAAIPANQFAMVKVFSSFAAAPGGGAGGALVLYTKDPVFNPGGNSVAPIRYKGFDIVREFPETDYGKSPGLMREKDDRRTLLWRSRPSMSASGTSFPFFSNERPGRYRVSVRGMTYDGRILSVDRIVQK